ncbi:MAG: sigma 54-interacting transcriptional regulator, partial [Thermoanaerobaculia bacterium]
RIIAATNRDLEEAVSGGQFRKDLFYRLNVLSCRLPPLRARLADLPLLANHFAGLHGRRLGRRPLRLSRATLACLMGYDWPGNVRELSNAHERASVLTHDDVIHPEDLPEVLLDPDLPGAEAVVGSYHLALNRSRARVVLEALDETAGNVSEAAERLGLHPKYLYRLMRNLGLKPRAAGVSAASLRRTRRAS